jgi:hypothetical protein
VVASAESEGGAFQAEGAKTSADNEKSNLQDQLVAGIMKVALFLKSLGISVASWLDLHLARFFGNVLGKSSEISQELARPDVCMSFLGTNYNCSERLTEITEYYGTIPDSILGCINLYVLPCVYGFLGSATAAVKYVRRQIDGHLLNFTDRGRIIQNEILGLVAGSVVGLFATYLTSATQAIATLSVSGIAFLAGYNIPALFKLFEDLSTRILQPGPQTSK